MRLGWLFLLFPSAAFAIAGCPVGVQLGNVTMATSLPVCLKFDGSQLGGCLVDCKGVCVELPLANKKGPVETTGTACSYSDNGSGNGDSDGSGNTPDEGPSGTKPIDGWLDFKPVIGDATGTSVSGAVAKLNKNLGVALRQVVDSTKQDSDNINSITHSAESFARDMKTTLYHLDRMSNDLFYTKNSNDALLGAAYQTNEHLQSMISKMNGSETSGGGSSAGGSSSADVAEIKKMMSYAMGMWAAQQGSLASVNNQMSSMLRDVGSASSSLSAIRDSVSNGGSGGGSGSDGSSIDYSKLPGSGDNPLSVKEGKYSSTCSGNYCFFDVAAIQKKLDEANKAISDKYQDIGDEVRDMFDFQLSGSAGVIECFDFFTYGGKDYRVCPPAKEYWNIIAALMMFIFYFIAFAIVFKR